MLGRELTIAIVYNHEEAITRGDPKDIIALQDTASTSHFLFEALCTLGYHAVKVPVRKTLLSLREALSKFSNQDTFIFNNCDGFKGVTLGSVKVTRTIEDLGFKHSGSTASVIALCTNKPRAKEALIRAGIPTPRYQVFRRSTRPFSMTFPVIIKPSAEDGSQGISINSVVTDVEGLNTRVAHVVQKYLQPALVEEFIPGRELAISILGNEELETFPAWEEDYSSIANPLEHLLHFEAKWDPNNQYYRNISTLCPAPLPPDIEQDVMNTAIAAYRVLGLRDFGRMDIRLYDGIPYIIDINEIPDLAPESGFAKNAMACGYTYVEVIEKILDLALRREGWR